MMKPAGFEVSPPELVTLTETVPAAESGTIAESSLLLTKVAGSEMAPKLIVAGFPNSDPFIVSAICVPAMPVAGRSEEICGGTNVSNSGIAFEVPPPGSGLVTCTVREFRDVDGRTNEIVPGSMYVELTFDRSSSTIEPEKNPVHGWS